VNTIQASVDAKGASHTDGAWPVEAKTNEVQDRTRLLRKLKNEDSYKQAVVSLSRGADVSVQQNNTIDLFEEYFTNEDHSHSYTPPSCRTVAVFRDPNEIKRSATKISWHPEGPNKLAVSYSIMQFQAAPPNMPIKSYIWDVNSPNAPDTEILPPSPLTSLVYNPRSPDHLVGGTYNGLIGKNSFSPFEFCL
jgi:dynein intermediate chain 2